MSDAIQTTTTPVAPPTIEPSKTPTLPETPSSKGAPVTPPKVPEESETTTETKLGAKHAELARREKRIQEKANALKESEAKAKKWEEVSSKAKETPWELLETLGLSLSDLVTAKLADLPKDNTPETPEDRIAKLEAKLAERDRLAKEAEEGAAKKADEDLYASHARQLTGYLQNHLKASEPGKFELISQMGDQGLDYVFNTCVQFHTETGKPMSYDDAFQAVEDFLFEELKTSNLLNTKRVKSYLQELEAASAPVAAPPAKGNAPKPPPPKPPSKTLSNGSKAGVIPVKTEAPVLSQRERIKHAAEMLAETSRALDAKRREAGKRK